MSSNQNLDKFSFAPTQDNTTATKTVTKRNQTVEKRNMFKKLDEIMISLDTVIRRLDKMDTEGFNSHIILIREEYKTLIENYKTLVIQQDKSKSERAKRFRFLLITIIIQIVSLFVGLKQGADPNFQQIWVNLLRMISGGI